MADKFHCLPLPPNYNDGDGTIERMSASNSMRNGAHPAVDRNDHEYSPPLDEEYERPVSPLQMPAGQIDGLESLQAESLMKGQRQSRVRRDSANSSLLHLDLPRFPSPAELAMSAMQYLPYPLVVLNNLKTLVMANEAMARLLGIEDGYGDAASDDGISVADRLRGQTLSQLGIDMLQDGRPVWVTWDSFLDSLGDDLGTHMDEELDRPGSDFGEGDVTPTAERAEPLSRHSSTNRNSTVHDAVVEVFINLENLSPACFARPSQKPATRHTFAKMIITVWEIDEEKFFTLTFTSTDSTQTSLPSSRGQSRQVMRASKRNSFGSRGSGSHSSPSSTSSGRSSNHGGSSNSSAITSPTNASMSASPFPPLGPPSKSTVSSAPSSLQKVTMMKDALLDTTEVPIIVRIFLSSLFFI